MNKIFTLVATLLALAGGVNAQTKPSITKNNTWNLAPEIMERWNYQPTTSTTQKAAEKGGMINAKGEVIECPNDELHDRMMATDPLYRRGFIQAQETIYQLVQQELADKRNGKSRKNGNGQGTVLERMSAPCVSGPNANVLKIPVVVHVMHLPGTAIGTNENISDATIQAGIQHLNDAFRKVGVYANGPFFTNSGITNSDVEIEFCLARRDPAGNATNGINRIATNYSNLFYK